MKHEDIIARMTLEEKAAFCSGASWWMTKEFPHLGIPAVRMTDGPHGLRNLVAKNDTFDAEISHPATCFPTASLTACSWDRELLCEMGQALGNEALAAGISIILGPGVNIQRNPLCGRNFEYFSEDPTLAGELAASWIEGVQSRGVGVSLKHYAGNSQENLRMTSDSLIDERALREIYLPAFEKAIKAARPATVMCAYNKLNGTYCSDNNYLLRDILRDEWGFEGVVVTDWGAMNDRVKAFEAGLDLEMPGGLGYYDKDVILAVKNGALAESLLDDCVDRLLELVLTAAKRLQPESAIDEGAHHQLARKIAAASGVLLKNEDKLLPLKTGQRIAVIGALAEHPRYQGTGSSRVNPTRLSSALDGFKEQGLDFVYYPGYEIAGIDRAELANEAVVGAAGCDVAIIFAGLTEDYESEGYDRSDMQLPANHNELIRRVTAVQPNTVVVLAGGAPIEMPWLGEVKAVLTMLLAGQAGGLAAVDLLTGKVNPSGKLAASYPLGYADVPSADTYGKQGDLVEYRESIYVGYRYYDKAGKEVLLPFGHGLSYTTFEYRDLTLSKSNLTPEDELTISMRVKNTGSQAGSEIVQVYVSDLTTGIFRPVRELRDFAKVHLKPGEEKKLTFALNQRAFACYIPSEHAWVVPDAEYQVSIGASSRDIRLSQTLHVHGVKQIPELSAVPVWYRNPVGEVSRSDFEIVLGKKVIEPEPARKGEYSMSSTLEQMQSSLIVRMVLRSLEKRVAGILDNPPPGDPRLRMMIEGIKTTPLKSLIALSKGAMPVSLAHGIVDAANGKTIRGLWSILKHIR